MAVITETVNPGDVISSALMRKIIELLNAHETALGGGGGGVTVPNLFGRTLAEARVSLQLQQLALGVVVDASGTPVDPNAAGSGTRVVIGQVPSPGQSTFTNGSVDLLLAATGGSSPAQPLQLNALVPSTQRVGLEMQIQGTGFAPVLAQNQVTFDGIAAPVTAGSTTQLFVTVPVGIPSAPTTQNGAPRSNVPVRVRRLTDNAEQQLSCTVQGPLTNALAITSITPNPVAGLVQITINGTGFSTTASNFRVVFESVEVTPTTATATALTVTIPSNIPGLNPPGRTVLVRVRRMNDATLSAAVSLEIEL